MDLNKCKDLRERKLDWLTPAGRGDVFCIGSTVTLYLWGRDLASEFELIVTDFFFHQETHFTWKKIAGVQL